MAEQAIRLSYPWRTVGKVFSSHAPNLPGEGSGVLVGPNLILTASHAAPWGATGSWWMRFVPAFRQVPGAVPDEPFGSSYVSEFRGVRYDDEVSGLDYVVCRLYTPLGRALGWMGQEWWGNEDEYERRRFIASGYPATFGGRPAVEYDIGIEDIDNDGDGLELEVGAYHGLTDGWSGGPLWHFPNQRPMVVGTLSGFETDEFDPRRSVFAGGRHMVDLVRFGLTNWPPPP